MLNCFSKLSVPPWAINQPPSPQFNLFLRTKPSPSLFRRALKRMKPPDFNTKKMEQKSQRKQTFGEFALTSQENHWGFLILPTLFFFDRFFRRHQQKESQRCLPRMRGVNSHLKMGWLGGGPTGVIKWDPFWGNQAIQIYGNFEAFVWAGNIMPPVQSFDSFWNGIHRLWKKMAIAAPKLGGEK